MGRQISIPENTEALAQQIAETVKNAQRAARQYSSIRVATCPPSREFPVDPMIYGHRNVQVDAWRETYPFRGEKSFTVPAIQRFLETL